MKKGCKNCEKDYDLKKSGRYCPKCGQDYWDGVCGFTKKLNKEELKANNEKFRKMNIIKITLLMMLFVTTGCSQIYYDEIAPADTSNYFLMAGSDGVFDTVRIEVRNDSLCIIDGDCLVNLVTDTWDKDYTDLINKPFIDAGAYLYSTEDQVSIGTTSNLGGNLNVVGSSRWEYPAGIINYNAGNGNLAAVTTGSNNVAYGSFNLATAVTPSYNLVSGISLARYATTATNNLLTGESNALNATVVNISSITGKENAQESSDISYSKINGYRNFKPSTGDIESSLINGYLNGGAAQGNTKNSLVVGTQNLYNKTDAVTTVTAIGIYNAYNSPSVDNSIFIGQSNGRYNTGALNKSILLGYEQAYSSGTSAPYRLHVGMYRNESLIYGEFDNEFVKINGDFESSGKVTVGDNVEGEAVNISGYDSEDDLTRVSIGTGLTMTAGTLNATGTATSAARVETFNYTLASADILYDNLSLNAITFETGDVDASLATNRITADVAGYYRVTINGSMFNNAGTQNSAYVRLKKSGTSMTEYETFTQMGADEYYPVHYSDVILLTAGQYITIEARRGVSTKEVYIDSMFFTMEKI